MLDPKNPYILASSFGGVAGLLRGFRTDTEQGLSTSAVGHADPHTVEADTQYAEKERVLESCSPHPAETRRHRLRRRIPRRSRRLSPTGNGCTARMFLPAVRARPYSCDVDGAEGCLGWFQDFRTPRRSDEPAVDWVEGVAVVLSKGSVKVHRFEVLNEKKEERGVERSGRRREGHRYQGKSLWAASLLFNESGSRSILTGRRSKKAKTCTPRTSTASRRNQEFQCITMALRGARENTPLQLKLTALVTLVVAVPEGLLLAVPLALSFATKRMNKENRLNEMSVVAGSVGVNCKLACLLRESTTPTNAEETEQSVFTGQAVRKLKHIKPNEENGIDYEHPSQDMALIAITGIEGPLRPGVTAAIAKCHRAGATVKTCTGDNILTARSIAAQCGIFIPGGVIVEGPVFRKLSNQDRLEIVPRLQVLARSSPEDKKILETLKSIGEIVGVTGDVTNDGPALKTANVGFSTGIAGTEVAKEASDIIPMNDKFTSIVKAIIRLGAGRVRHERVQLHWTNIIVDTFAALALATGPATESLLNRKPDRKVVPSFSYDMILMQSAYQITIILLSRFKGLDWLNLPHTLEGERTLKTLVFNAFGLAQTFNSVNCRRLDNKLNVFEGITKNRYFVVTTLIEIGIRVLIVFVGNAAFTVRRIAGRKWGISLALGFVSIPWGAIIRCMPNGPSFKLFDFLGSFGKPESVLTTESPAHEGWGGAIALVQDDLGTFASIHGARMRSSSSVNKQEGPS
ncbi:hypothetical protein NMY22_g11051 [Coprinellus aureogranulatus]|nr:hypothetical protein NMY22_g11051 [Coprinellus aureogranulatus]